MTDLQRVEISGFKGIEHLEYEPSGVNLVTGRNNTGKTSLLEAIALAFDPTYVEEFGEDIDSLIHEDFEECRITVGTAEETREMEIRQPTEEETIHGFVSLLETNLSDGYSIQTTIDEVASPSSNTELPEVWERMDFLVDRAAQQVVREHLNIVSAEELKDEYLIFSIEDSDYPYLAPGKHFEDLMENATKRLFDMAKEEFSKEADDMKEAGGMESGRTPDFFFSKPSDSLYQFLKEPPDLENEIIFLKSKNLLSAPDFDPVEDAVKRDKLGDYVKETGLADNLKTFNFDTLIFKEKDEERYPVPYDFMGDGFKTIVGLLWELMDDEIEGQIVLLEEPENHMHPGYVLNVVHFLIELSRDEDVQLFTTTHNSDFINAFFNDNRVGEQEAFLEEEFSLLQMQKHAAVVEDYETAREDLEELHLDLRGI